MDRKNEQEILQRYREGRCSESELRQLDAWYDSWNTEERLLLTEVQLEEAESRMRSKVMDRIGFNSTPRRLWRRVSIAAAAAAVVIAVGVSFYYNLAEPLPDTTDRATSDVHDIAPGKNIAILTLPNGEVVSLSENKDAVVIDASALSYGDGTKVSNTTPTDAPDYERTSLHTITTPRGGQYQVILSDGTKVWLNAASSIKFPASFAGAKQRRIDLTGEAYLEVTKDQEHPFIVVSGTQEIEVLGTHFNVNDYLDEPVAQTTLIEGSVRVRPLHTSHTNAAKVLLKPGQKSLITGQEIVVRTANVNEVIAWKEGDFRFEDQSVPDIMKQLARWYDVDVVYLGDVSDVKLNASISRGRNVSQILNMMEKTGEVHFKIEGRKIIVTK
jgi:transmembrane sensor